MRILVDASKVKSVSACKAVKDVRFYLNGIVLAPNGDAVGTDGYCMAIASKAFTPEEGFEGLIVGLNTEVPKKCEYVEFDTETKLARFLNDVAEQIAVSAFEVIDHRFYDYNRVVPKKIQTLESIGLDVKIVSKGLKVFHSVKHTGLKFEFYGADSAIKLTHPQHPDVLMIVMPYRL